MRFKDLKECIPNISDRMLTLHLKEMEHDGLVERNVFAEVPPRVEYKLSTSSEKLVPIWGQIEVWGAEHKKNQLEYQAPAAIINMDGGHFAGS